MSNLQSALKSFIQNELAVGRGKELQPEDDLFTSGILDSLGILQLVLFIEEQFSVQVPDEDVVFENFHSLNAISEYLERRKIENSDSKVGK